MSDSSIGITMSVPQITCDPCWFHNVICGEIV
jgi:hypothetical protein